jgi:acetyl-CoA acyltransferase
MSTPEAVILGFARSPLGKYGGILKDLRPDDMIAEVMRAAIARVGIDVRDIGEVIVGCANQAGEDNRNIARMATLLAGLPVDLPGITLNRLCASGLDAIIAGARRILLGEHDLVLVGGVESMTRAPYILGKHAQPYKLGAPELFDSSLGWRFFNEKMRTITPPEANGVTAERLAKDFSISRERQDQFALESHQKALAAQKQGDFLHEIIPLQLGANLLDKDEGPRADSSREKLGQLKAAFVPLGTVTAGNSSTLNDGAAALIISSAEYARAHGLKPRARILGYASKGVDPKVMGLGPVPASHLVMQKLKLSINDFDLIEINEAFAAQVLAVIDSLGINEERVNVAGGAIALGHPLGCSGARIVISLINQLQKKQKRLGLASLCVGVGQGVSLVLEALD